jgi:hypothetical protein
VSKFAKSSNEVGGLIGSDSASYAEQNAHGWKLVSGLLDELALVSFAKCDAQRLVID